MKRSGKLPLNNSRHSYPPTSPSQLIIWGIHPIEEAMAARPEMIHEIFTLPSFGKKKGQAALLRRLKKQGVRIYQVLDFHKFSLPRGAVHQGICASVSRYWEVELDSLIQKARLDQGILVMCDQVEDPQNLGAIIRASVAFNCSGLIIPKRQNAPINGTVVKASSGAIFHTSICNIEGLPASIRALKEAGIYLAGLDIRAKKAIFSHQVPRPLCLVLGSESKGIRKNIKKELDMLLYIPINPRLDSLNVACAAAVTLYEFQRDWLSHERI